MIEDEIRTRARELLAELMHLDALATSQTQRREFKNAREYLQCAVDTGADTALQLGSYHFATISNHIHEVQKGKKKGIERSERREKKNRDAAAPKNSNSYLVVRYKNHEFSLKLSEYTNTSLSLVGILELDERQRFNLRTLSEEENETIWCLDDNGERLKSRELFDLSPWSTINANGETKLLCRFLNVETGEIRLDTPDGYDGEIFDWVRKKD